MRSSHTLGLRCFALIVLAASPVPANADVVVWRPEDGGNGHAYEVVAEPLSIGWNAARTQAHNRGGYLASVNSAAENAFIYNLADSPQYWYVLTSDPVRHFGPWLGASQAPNAPTPASNWSWDDGTAMFYNNWLPGQPDNFGGVDERFAHFFGRDNIGGRTPMWNDATDPPQGGQVIAYVVEFVPEPAGLALLALAAVITYHRPRRN